MPADTPKVFRIECKAYGARVTLVDGLIDDCGRMVAQKKDAEGWLLKDALACNERVGTPVASEDRRRSIWRVLAVDVWLD